jgi:hypothetical protein
MSRITINDLRSELKILNSILISKGFNVFIREQGRNGYQATDQYSVREDGSLSCESNVGCGTSREVIGYSKEVYYKTLAYSKPPKSLTRKQAKRLLEIFGIDFNNDFHKISTHEISDLLVKYAKLTKYRKPANANGSTSRYFMSI